ncbi:hypothetical protein [Streptomyces daghestanicus]|uniref:Integral membrane protein n=1 Tax=Streptomyces daghestanicus TaxID=66885 RepID=A0ABQ3Q2V2_9ACTN|nr:hypothetical protein [Streptomyces daghestanicus]GGU20680.1 hypothetical protein GCM10010259_08670 [Streptomyces daghestanicus]GHI31577.1 hypothetical protein Sdagh_33070 [Streptomyces daghestanicus]
MSSRTRARGVKVAGVTTVRIPRQRGRRRSDPFVVVVPERPSLAREVLGFLGGLLWRSRRALAPTGLAVLLPVVAGLLHLMAWWSGLVLAPAAAGPLVWLLIVQRRRPAGGAVLAWRAGVAALAASALAWLATAAGCGPLAGALELWWLLMLITAQSAWLVVRRTH